jgi:thiamine pyrophosphate-dependent acetolactate synthase large subunit-like protein
MNGGDIVASVLVAQGVRHIFTLCGGHISPILVSSKRDGIDIVDVRDEASAVFAADASARMTGIPGVAAVTAGPGLTNTLTAVENALLAQSPLIVIGGATATVLKGRGALQDIDQMALMRPAVKRAFAVKRVRNIGPVMEQAFRIAQEGVPGPVFVELPVDLLYDESVVREWYLSEAGGGESLVGKLKTAYVKQHLFRVFRGADRFKAGPPVAIDPMEPRGAEVDEAVKLLAGAKKPVLVVGGQTITRALEADAVAEAIERLGIPTFLGGTARGLLGAHSEIQFRHKRTASLRDADVVVVCGFPFDFRMGYGWKINSKAKIITVNRDKPSLTKNRRPALGVHGDAGRFLQLLARRAASPGSRWESWFGEVRAREDARDAQIDEMAEEALDYVNPVDLVKQVEARMDDDSIIVVDGGDFVATAAYVMKPRGPLSWLDPGVFGTLGVGGGFAVGATAVRPDAEVWLIYGDGASAYTLAEIDTLARHGKSVIAVIGNDASWGQIARDQITILGDLVGTVLARTAYHTVAEGYGGKGLEIKRPEDVGPVLDEAKRLAKAGHPVVVNAWIGKSEFRKGSISI